MRKRKTAYAYARFVFFLGHEFRWPAFIFTLLVLVGGLWLKLAYHDKENHTLGYNEACYAIYCMVFFETGNIPFPREWYLQVFFFLVPVIGLGAVADSVVRLGYFIFTAKQKLQEWHIMNASMKRNHIVVAGAGRVGYRILLELLTLKEDLVVIDRNVDTPLVEEIRDRGVTIIHGECRSRKTLELANVQHAKAIILATDDDLANIDAGLTAREIKPEIRVVLRLFDDTMANKVAPAFRMPAISTSASAATAFVAAVTERNIFQSFQMGGRQLHLADLIINARGKLAGRTVGELQKDCAANVVMHMSNGKTDVNPQHTNVFRAEDHIILITDISHLSKIEELNK